MYQLYYYPKNASLAPHLVLQHLKEDFELILVDRDNNQQKSADYLALNPAGRIPVLIHDDIVISESVAICLYLSEQNQHSTLIPAIGDKNRAEFFQWLMYLNNTIQSEFLIYYYPEKHTTSQACVASIQEAQEIRLMNMFQLLDTQLKDKPYFVGDSITVCDYFLLMVSIWGRHLPKPPHSLNHLGPHLRKLAGLDVVTTVFKTEGITLTG